MKQRCARSRHEKGLRPNQFRPPSDETVHQSVVDGLRGEEPSISVRVPFDLLDRLADVPSLETKQLLFGPHVLFGLDADINRGTTDAGGGLVNEHASMGDGEPVARLAGGDEKLPHTRGVKPLVVV